MTSLSCRIVASVDQITGSDPMRKFELLAASQVEVSEGEWDLSTRPESASVRFRPTPGVYDVTVLRAVPAVADRRPWYSIVIGLTKV